MSITFDNAAQTLITTHYLITCCCDETVYATADNFEDAHVLAQAIERHEFHAPSNCCNDPQAWLTPQTVGEDYSVNLSNTNALNTLAILGLLSDDPEDNYCGQIDSAVLSAALTTFGDDLLPRYRSALTQLAENCETVQWC